MTYSAEEFSRAGDKYLGRAYSEMDCQKFVEKCMADVGLRVDLAGANAWYRKMSWTGSPEECVKRFGCVPKGALLFILEKDGKEPAKYRGDGKGNASHIGIKTGRGEGAIHSSSSRGCVAVSKFKDRTIGNGGWNRVGLWERFTYRSAVDRRIQQDGDVGGETSGTVLSFHESETARAVPLFHSGVVFAESGNTVNLRKAKGGALVDRISIGTEIEILSYGNMPTGLL